MNKKLITSTLMILVTFFIPKVLSQESIKIASMDNFAPYNSRGKDGAYIGIDVAIIEAVLNELGIKYTHMPLPWNRAVIEFEKGTADMLFQLEMTPERYEKWNMVGPIRKNNFAYFVQKDSNIRDIKMIKDLKGLDIGLIRGYSYSKEFLDADYLTKAYVTDITQNVNKLMRGRIDIVMENELPFKYESKKMGFENVFRMLPTYSSESERYVAFPKNKKGIRIARRFQKKLNELKSNGSIQSILDNWFPDHI